MQKWIKMPGPGQFRGEGEWWPVPDRAEALNYYDLCKATDLLPTAEQDEKPDD